MENKKIKIFIGYLEYGSALCNRLFAYSQGLTELGYKPEIIAYHNVRLHDFKNENNIVIHQLPPTFVKNRYLRMFYSFIYLFYYLIFKTSKKDHMMIYGGYDQLLLFVLSGRTNVIHEITECPEIVGPYFLPLKLYFWCCRKLKGMFVISRNLKQYFVDKGVKSENIEVINIIVDTNRFNSLKNVTDSDYITYCGIISKQKDGVDILLDTFAEFHKLHKNVKLRIIGRYGQDWDEKEAEIFISNNKLVDAIEFTGLVSPAKMPEYLKAAKILVLPRPNNKQAFYGFPTKLGEYLLSNKPVVVSKVGNISDFLTNKVSALLVEPNNKKDLLEAFGWLITHENESRIIARNGYNVAMDNFSCKNVCQKIINVMFLKNNDY